MPFNADKPTDQVKIRRIAADIRPNWKAIEEASQTDSDDSDPLVSEKFKYWAVNFFDRTEIPSAPGDNAPTVDNAIVLFSKKDADTSLPELFVRHSDDSISQLTKGGTNVSPVGYANNGEISLIGGLEMKFAKTPTIGSSASQTITWAGAGAFDLGLNSFSNNCLIVLVNPVTSATGGNTWKVHSITKDDFVIKNGNFSAPYNVIAIGN